MRPHRFLLAAAVFATAAAAVPPPPPLGQSDTGQPTTYDFLGERHPVTGYRSATWGMTPAEVRAAVAKDFPGAEIGTEVTDPVRRTRAFVAAVKALPPGPTPAAITFVFGANSGRLIHVNLDWQYADATPAQRQDILAAGSRAVAGYNSYFWKFGSVARGVVTSVNSLVLFAAADEQGNKLEVRVQGVPYQVKTSTGLLDAPPPTGQALLHIGLSSAGAEADIYTIKPGDF